MHRDNRMWNSVLFVAVLLLSMNRVSGALEMDYISFDPAIIASGDEVDIIIQYHDDQVYDDRVGEKEYSFQVRIIPDDDLTKEYVSITDSVGDDLKGRIFSGGYYNKVFRVKVSQDAPSGTYQFRLEGQWFKDGEPLGFAEYVRFMMPVKREGIILDISTISTVPAEVRPGDDYVKVSGYVENVGEKDAKSVHVSLKLPEGFSASYSNNNQVWIGRANSGEQKEAIFYVDVDENLDLGVYEFTADFSFMDVDSNEYEKSVSIPFLVKARPNIIVEKVEGSGLAGKTEILYVTVKNVGAKKAEAVDVRILKQNAQPFSIDVRSDYVGELAPGEEGLAIFKLGVNRDAELKTHDFKLIIRAKGDSDEGDDNIYIFNRRAQFDVVGTAPNYLLYAGIGLGAIIFLGFGIKRMRRKR